MANCKECFQKFGNNGSRFCATHWHIQDHCKDFISILEFDEKRLADIGWTFCKHKYLLEKSFDQIMIIKKTGEIIIHT